MLWSNNRVCMVFVSGDTHVIMAPKETLPRLCLTTRSHTTVNGRRALMSGRGRFYRTGKEMSFPHEIFQAWCRNSVRCQLIKLSMADLCDSLQKTVCKHAVVFPVNWFDYYLSIMCIDKSNPYMPFCAYYLFCFTSPHTFVECTSYRMKCVFWVVLP